MAASSRVFWRIEMSHFLDRLNYFSNPRESFSDGFGVTNAEDRTCDDYARRYTDLQMLVMLREHATPVGETIMVPDRYVRASLCGVLWPKAIRESWIGTGRSGAAHEAVHGAKGRARDPDVSQCGL
jgi:hypothetical protein